MVERLEGMPTGTLGFPDLGPDQPRRVFPDARPTREQLERGEKVSFLVEAADDFHGLDLGALWEDVKVAGSVGLKYRSSWDRLAVVTEKDWMRHGIAAFGWLIPGEIRVFEPGDLEEAKAWTGGAAS